MTYIGIDVHKTTSQVAVLPAAADDDAEPLEEVRVNNENLAAVGERYAGGKAVLEATSNYYTIYDTLDEYLDVTVANPLELSWIANSSQKTDEIDAEKLAKLLKADMVPASYVPPADIRKRRALTRGRQTLIEERTKWKNQVHALLDKNGIRPDVTVFSATGREYLADLTLDEPYQQLLETYLTCIDELTAKIDRLKAEIEQRAASVEQTQLLQTAPGVGALSAMVIHAELGEVDRFDTADQVVSYAGLDPTVQESADSRTEGGISKEGNSHLRNRVVQCASTAVHTVEDPYLTDFYKRLRRKNKPKKVALVATGRKLLVSLYYMLTRSEEYDPNQ